MSLYPRCPDAPAMPPRRRGGPHLMDYCAPGEIAGGPVDHLEAGQRLWAHDPATRAWTPVVVVKARRGLALRADGPSRSVRPDLSPRAYFELEAIARAWVGDTNRHPDPSHPDARLLAGRYAVGWLCARQDEQRAATAATA